MENFSFNLTINNVNKIDVLESLRDKYTSSYIDGIILALFIVTIFNIVLMIYHNRIINKIKIESKLDSYFIYTLTYAFNLLMIGITIIKLFVLVL